MYIIIWTPRTEALYLQTLIILVSTWEYLLPSLIYIYLVHTITCIPWVQVNQGASFSSERAPGFHMLVISLFDVISSLHGPP